MTPMAQSVQMAKVTPRVRHLRDLATIRSTARQMLADARGGSSKNFRVHDEKIAEAAAIVAQITRDNYPDLKIPFHSRWRHFEIGVADKTSSDHSPRNLAYELIGDPRRAVGAGSRLEWLTRAWDLVMVSVLLDAGAGDQWTYHDERTGMTFRRSEGLGIASLRMFQSGMFSANPSAEPCRVDALRLSTLDTADLAKGFQTSESNPLAGLEGRAELLRSFGEKLLRPDYEMNPLVRPGDLARVALDQSKAGVISIPNIFSQLLNRLSSMWPGRPSLDGSALGDVWSFAGAGHGTPAPDYVPFHKLTQWLTYSLAEPLIATGIQISGLDELTGLPEYRNGGLLIDSGVLELLDPKATHDAYRPDAPLIVEWRALTVALLDEIADQVRVKLEQPDLKLAQILQGGTWAAGRILAAKKRGPLAPPPLKIKSDGTVF